MTASALPVLPALDSAAPRGAPWKFWGSALWTVAILATAALVATGGTVAALLWLDPGPELSEQDLLRLLLSHAALLDTVVAAAVAGACAILALAVRLSRLGVRDYLGLTMPRGFDLKVGIAGLVVLYLLFALASYVIGQPQMAPSLARFFQGGLSSGERVALAAWLIVGAPISEEVLIRGFLLRGWSASRLGPTCAIVLTAAVWAAMHTHYELLSLVYIFCLGLLFGWLRQRSGSTPLTVLLHAVQNTWALVLAAIYFASA